jgi:hypothetical protein
MQANTAPETERQQTQPPADITEPVDEPDEPTIDNLWLPL